MPRVNKSESVEILDMDIDNYRPDYKSAIAESQSLAGSPESADATGRSSLA